MAGTPPYYDNEQMPGAGGIRVPNEVFGSSGPGVPAATMALIKEVDFNVAEANSTRGVSGVVTLYPSECQANVITFNNSSSNNVNFALPAVFPGNEYLLSNVSGNSVTFLVTGKTGVTLANNNSQSVVCSGLKGDIIPQGAAIAI